MKLQKASGAGGPEDGLPGTCFERGSLCRSLENLQYLQQCLVLFPSPPSAEVTEKSLLEWILLPEWVRRASSPGCLDVFPSPRVKHSPSSYLLLGTASSHYTPLPPPKDCGCLPGRDELSPVLLCLASPVMLGPGDSQVVRQPLHPRSRKRDSRVFRCQCISRTSWQLCLLSPHASVHGA